MSVRFTSSIRDSIVSAMLRHAFEDEAKALVKRRADLALAVYEDVYSEADRKKMAALPDGWLPSAESISARFGGSYESLRFSGALYGDLANLAGDVEPLHRRIKETHRHGCSKNFDGSHPIAERHLELDGIQRELLDRVRSAKRQAISVVSSVSTIGRLKEVWPETAPFLARYEKKPPSLPAIPRDDLNHAFRLPVAEAAA